MSGPAEEIKKKEKKNVESIDSTICSSSCYRLTIIPSLHFSFKHRYAVCRCFRYTRYGFEENMLKHDNEVYFQAFTMEKPSGERICKF